MSRPTLSRASARVLLTILLFSTAACAGGESGAGGDTAAGTGAASGDTAAAGADHSNMAANRGPARDADHEFLRMMSDHHQGLVDMASAAMTKASTQQTQGDAHQLHTKQEQEQRQMVDMVRTAYNETLRPVAMPNNRAMNDTLQQKSGAEYDRTFYRMVIDHHREGIRMMDEFRPRLQRAEVRQMLDKMRADQQREIGELETKMNRLS